MPFPSPSYVHDIFKRAHDDAAPPDKKLRKVVLSLRAGA